MVSESWFLRLLDFEALAVDDGGCSEADLDDTSVDIFPQTEEAVNCFQTRQTSMTQVLDILNYPLIRFLCHPSSSYLLLHIEIHTTVHSITDFHLRVYPFYKY